MLICPAPLNSATAVHCSIHLIYAFLHSVLHSVAVEPLFLIETHDDDDDDDDNVDDDDDDS